MGSFAPFGGSQPTVLTVPGLNGSGPAHWQTLWERDRPSVVRAELGMWNTPHRNSWVTRLDQAIRQAEAPVVLAAHSLGCIAVAWWAALSPQPYGWRAAGRAGRCRSRRCPPRTARVRPHSTDGDSVPVDRRRVTGRSMDRSRPCTQPGSRVGQPLRRCRNGRAPQRRKRDRSLARRAGPARSGGRGRNRRLRSLAATGRCARHLDPCGAWSVALATRNSLSFRPARPPSRPRCCGAARPAPSRRSHPRPARLAHIAPRACPDPETDREVARCAA